MIEYHITIKQLDNGVISFRCETPAGSATLQEMDVAREFQKQFKNFTLKNGKCVITHDWSKNDPKKN